MIKNWLQRLRLHQPQYEQAVTIEQPEKTNFDETADVVVVGFGGAGAATAIEACDQGLETIVLERFQGGGATNISGGVYYAGGGTRIQKQAGIEDTPENMFNYLHQEVQGAVSDETLQQFCNESVQNFDWMCANGVPFEASLCPFKTSYPPNQYYFYYSGNESFKPFSDKATPAARGHRGHAKGISGQAIYQPLKQSAINKGAKILSETKVIALLQDTNQRVIGVKALSLKDNAWAKLCHRVLNKLHIVLRYIALFWPPLFQLFASITNRLEKAAGTVLYIQAKKGVSLSTGGFYANAKMLDKHAPAYAKGSPLGTFADDGSGIKLASTVGGQTELLGSVSAWRFINPPESLVKGVLVGPSGARICNEMLYGAQLGEKIMKGHDGKGWIIVDQATYKAAFKDLSLKKGLWFHLILGSFYLLLGVKKASNINALANKLNIHPGTLQNTINEYNAIANSDQEDPLGKPKSHMPTIGHGPYYAINASYDYFFVPCPSLTLGGLKVNESTGEVLNQEGQTIKGLYAAGRTAVGIASKGYVSGLSIADCVFSGRRVGKHAKTEQV